MLIEFSVENYLSFKERVALSLEADSGVSELETSNTFQTGRMRLLKSAALYGANASGKSNFLAAMRFMRNFVVSSSKNYQAGEAIPVEPFRLNTFSIESPSLFEAVFLMNGMRYRYGFQVNRQEVVSEWFFSAEKKVEKRLFVREGTTFTISPAFKERRSLEKQTRPNALFISTAAQLNDPIASKALHWFASVAMISGLYDENLIGILLNKIDENKRGITDLLKNFALGFEDIGYRKISKEEFAQHSGLPENALRQVLGDKNVVFTNTNNIFTVHTVYDNNNQEVGKTDFSLEDSESEGTKKIVALAGPLLDVLQTPQVLFFDEFDARLHPLLSRTIVSLFNSNQTNPRGAQIVFATHDTNLLSNELLRRDQVWFAEKTPTGATDLYCLADFNVNGAKVRNDAAYGKNYILGKYGAIPYIGDVASLFGGGDE